MKYLKGTNENLLKGTNENLPLVGMSAGIDNWFAKIHHFSYAEVDGVFSQVITSFNNGANTITLSEDISEKLETAGTISVGGIAITVASVAGNVVTIDPEDISALVAGTSEFTFNYRPFAVTIVATFWETLEGLRTKSPAILPVANTLSRIDNMEVNGVAADALDRNAIYGLFEGHLVAKAGMDANGMTIEDYTI